MASLSTDGACPSSAGERAIQPGERLKLEDDDVLLLLGSFMGVGLNFYNSDAKTAIREEVQRRNLQLPSRSASSDGQGVEANSASDRPPS